MTTERLLSDTAPAEDAPEVETTDEAPREGMTPTEWATGIRPVRRSTIIYDKGHLLADLDDLGSRIEAAPADEDVDDLIDEYEALAAEVKSGTKYVAEQRSEDWQTALRDAEIKRLGFKKDKDGHVKSTEDALTLGFAIIAAHIVEPEGVAADTIRAIYDATPQQADALARLVARTNSTRVDAVESRDFSSRRSANRSTKGSSGR